MACGCNEDSDVGEFIEKVVEKPNNLVNKMVRVRFDYNRGYTFKSGTFISATYDDSCITETASNVIANNGRLTPKE